VPFVFNPQINRLAFVFLTVIGVVFGYFPALNATNLNLIDALRHK
jgi:putative ABC transport system permease protein